MASVPHHKLWGTRLPLGQRVQVLCHPMRLVWRHLAAGQLLQGALSDWCWALIRLSGWHCAGLLARLYFAARADMVLQLQRLALHYLES